MKVIVFGSFNIDKVYSMPHLPEKGETLYCSGFEIHVGGKGLNQAISFAESGAEVYAAGKTGDDGSFLVDYLSSRGVDTSAVDTSGTYTGHTIIEIDPDGQNQMILFGGANREITPALIDEVLAKHADADLLMMQYEISEVEYLAKKAHEMGIKTALNPSPLDEKLLTFPYDLIDIVILNEPEGKYLTGETEPGRIAEAMLEKNGGCVILTLGAAGSVYCDKNGTVSVPAFKADAVDTTGAGDTFTGYCIHALLSGKSPLEAMRTGAAASAVEVTRLGAAETIPGRAEVEAFLKANS